MRLTAKYQPLEIAEFIGLDEPKRIIGKWLESPYPAAFLFAGESGTGKSAMAKAIARALNGEQWDSPFTRIFIPSQDCKLEMVREIQNRIMYAPWGSHWVIQVDEADLMSTAAQNAFLSLLDSIPDRVVIIFTCNQTEGLEPRFLSRCCQVRFSSYGLNGAGSAFLKHVWDAESSAPAPNFVRVLKDSRNNLRDALMVLERELLAVTQ